MVGSEACGRKKESVNDHHSPSTSKHHHTSHDRKDRTPHCTLHTTLHTTPHLGVKVLRRQRQLYHSPPLPVAVKVTRTAALHRPWCDVDLGPWQIQHRLKRQRKREEDARRGKRIRGRLMCAPMGACGKYVCVCVCERERVLVAAGSSTTPHPTHHLHTTATRQPRRRTCALSVLTATTAHGSLATVNPSGLLSRSSPSP